MPSEGRSASFTTPNATCPVCGARVFFYQNDFGSRVYFDDLGPPWPKHPCTDIEPLRVRTERPVQPNKVVVEVKHRALAASSVMADPAPAEPPVEPEYLTPLRTIEGWDRCTVKRCTLREEVAYFVVNNSSDPTNKSIRFSTTARADLPRAGETLFLLGDRMSFFSFEEFAPQEVTIDRKRSKAVSSSRKRKTRRKKRRK
ncbi:MAG: hypothetical protein ABL931_00215 [Usitatibacteraceae bacterium]